MLFFNILLVMCAKFSESFNPKIVAMAHELQLDRELPVVDPRCLEADFSGAL